MPMKNNDKRNKIRSNADGGRGLATDRRSFMKTAGVAGVAGLTGVAGCLGGDGEGGPINFGAIYLLSGFASVYGESAQLGIEMATEEINDNGGINGREIGDILYRDSEASPDTAVQHARNLVEGEGVDMLIGLDSSGVALQVAPIMEQLQKPLVITHAATPFVTNPGEGDRAVGNDYVFRAGQNLAQNLYGAAVTADENTDAESWTTIGPNYAFGTQTWEYFKAYTQGMNLGFDYLEDATAYPELGAGDFTAHINQVISAEPDGVVTSLWGGDLITFIEQAQNTEFFDVVDELLMTVGAATDALRPLGDNMPEGLWGGTRYWFLTPDTATNTEFRETFMERNDGRVPSYNAQNAYVGMHLYKKAIEEAGSTEADAVIEALEGVEMDAPVGDLRINPESHQAELPAVWGQTTHSDDWDVSILDPVERIPAEPETLRDLLDGSGWPAGV